jgi:hypothetical protein
MKASSSSETSADIQWTTSRYIPEDSTLQNIIYLAFVLLIPECEMTKSFIITCIYIIQNSLRDLKLWMNGGTYTEVNDLSLES